MEVDRAPGACGARGLSTRATGRPRARPADGVWAGLEAEGPGSGWAGMALTVGN